MVLEQATLSTRRRAPKRFELQRSLINRELNSRLGFIFARREEDGYVQDAEGKRVPVVLQYSSFDFLKDKAKVIVEAHAKEALQRWNV